MQKYVGSFHITLPPSKHSSNISEDSLSGQAAHHSVSRAEAQQKLCCRPVENLGSRIGRCRPQGGLQGSVDVALACGELAPRNPQEYRHCSIETVALNYRLCGLAAEFAEPESSRAATACCDAAALKPLEVGAGYLRKSSGCRAEAQRLSLHAHPMKSSAHPCLPTPSANSEPASGLRCVEHFHLHLPTFSHTQSPNSV